MVIGFVVLFSSIGVFLLAVVSYFLSLFLFTHGCSHFYLWIFAYTPYPDQYQFVLQIYL